MTDVTTRTLPHWHYVAKDVMHRAPHEPNVRTPASGAVSQFCPYVDACQSVKGSPVVLVARANFNFRHGTFKLIRLRCAAPPHLRWKHSFARRYALPMVSPGVRSFGHTVS
jgi:hypothetical protein